MGFNSRDAQEKYKSLKQIMANVTAEDLINALLEAAASEPTHHRPSSTNFVKTSSTTYYAPSSTAAYSTAASSTSSSNPLNQSGGAYSASSQCIVCFAVDINSVGILMTKKQEKKGRVRNSNSQRN